MTFLTSHSRVLVYRGPVDFRKGHNGLMALVSKAGLDLWSGDLVVFFSKCRKKAKLLVADETGVWLHYKQLSRGRFSQQIQYLNTETYKRISQEELGLLLSGSRYQISRAAEPWSPPSH